MEAFLVKQECDKKALDTKIRKLHFDALIFNNQYL